MQKHQFYNIAFKRSTQTDFTAAVKRILSITIENDRNDGTELVGSRKFSTGVRIKGLDYLITDQFNEQVSF